MQEAIFDIRPGQANKFNRTHREMHEYVQIKMMIGHDAVQAIKDIQAPTYDMQPYPSTTKLDPGYATKSIPIIKEEKGYALYVWNQYQDTMWDSKKTTERNIKQTHRISVGQCYKEMCQKLEAEPGNEAVKASPVIIGILRLIKRLMYNYQSYKYLYQAVHESLRKLYYP